MSFTSGLSFYFSQHSSILNTYFGHFLDGFLQSYIQHNLPPEIFQEIQPDLHRLIKYMENSLKLMLMTLTIFSNQNVYFEVIKKKQVMLQKLQILHVCFLYVKYFDLREFSTSFNNNYSLFHKSLPRSSIQITNTLGSL